MPHAAINNLAVALQGQARHEEAVDAYMEAFARSVDGSGTKRPGTGQAKTSAPYVEALRNAGATLLQHLQRPAEAERCFARALEAAPGSASAHRDLATVLGTFGPHRQRESRHFHERAAEMER